MKPAKFALTALIAAITMPTAAAAPGFDTPAPVAYLVDLSSDAVLFTKDADRRMPPASMAKIMTVYVAFDLLKQGKIKLSDQFEVRPETWRRWHGPAAGSTMFLSTGERVSVENLLKGIVTLSGNDACVVLAEGIAGTEQAFVEHMNRAAKKLGLSNSNFGNSNGWPDGGITFTTARDLAKLAEATILEHPQYYKKFYSLPSFTWGRTMGAGDAITQANRDPLLGRVAGADGLKTGHTDEAGYGFTGSADQNGRRLIMVMAGLTSFNQRREESVRFMDWGFRAWKAQPIVAKGKRVESAEVQLGDASTVGLVAPRNLTVTLPGGGVLTPDMRLRVVYEGPVKAPIKAGQHIADLIVETPEMAPQRLPLVAETDVGEAGFFRRAWAGLASFFG
ncbi:MAG: D-alanyl-D-alanine carboxypeptidase family protein [Pseudomonadota bacterium]